LHNPHVELGNTPTHRYNLQPRPTKQQERLNLMQIAQQSTYTEHLRPQLHFMMTQISMKAGIKIWAKGKLCGNKETATVI